jgi:hypothetical protein
VFGFAHTVLTSVISRQISGAHFARHIFGTHSYSAATYGYQPNAPKETTTTSKEK